MRFVDLKAMIEGYLRSVDFEKYGDLEVYPGPNDPRIPDWYVLITMTGGPGYNTEGLFDGVSYQVKMVGKQHDYTSAEDTALVIDKFIMSFYTGKFGNTWLTHFQRIGGRPAALMVDDADRHHFVASYVADVES